MMKKTLVICCVAILFGLLLTFTTVRAAESDALFEGDAKCFVEIAESRELFSNFKALYPGCDVSRTVHVHNPDSQTARVYLYAKAVSEEYTPLLEQIALSVLDENGNTLYTSANVTNKMLLCELAGGQNLDVRVRLHVNRKADSDFKCTDGKISFVFAAEEYAVHQDDDVIPMPKTGSHPAGLAAALAGEGISFGVLLTVWQRSRRHRKI